MNLSTDSARFYCYCMLEKVEVKFPTPEAASQLKKEDLENPEWVKETKACIAGFWSSKDREDFLSNCITTASKGLTEEKARFYCECMLFKIEKKYPVAADAGNITEEDMKKPEWQQLIQGCLKF